MQVVGIYSFNGGQAVIQQHYADYYHEVLEVIAAVDARTYRTKLSAEKTMLGKSLYSPPAINRAFKAAFAAAGWTSNIRVPAHYTDQYYVEGYQPAATGKGAFRELDFVKGKLGVEVQLGKYAFMVYNVCAKMTIFRNLGFINAGIEIVPVKEFAKQMSTGVSYFEQFVWDLEQRGVSNIDIPVLILGVK